MVDAWASLRRRPNALAGVLLVGIVLTGAALGAVWTPFDPIDVDYHARLASPSTLHLLGTDEWGRDVLSRLLAGACGSMAVAAATVVAAMLPGTLLGAAAGYFGGWFERIVLALMDALLAFPSLILALAMVAVLGASSSGVVVAMGTAYLPSVVRVIRSVAAGLRHRQFIEASAVMGNSGLYTLWRHVLPNTAGPVAVLATSLFGWALLAESALSFLGLGLPPPAPSWGGMLADSRAYFEEAPWLALAPGIAISMALLGINLLGDALRDAADPRGLGR